MHMKVLLALAFTLVASSVLAEQCVTTVTGRTVCKPSATAAANPATGTVASAQRYPNGTTTADTNTGAKAAYNPNTGTAVTTQKYANGVTTAQSNTGAKAAYNPHTGNAATQQTNQNGVKDTQTTAGGKAKTKNGMGVAEAPNGTKCARGANYQGCKPN
jgi:thiol:disulfide interchange protein